MTAAASAGRRWEAVGWTGPGPGGASGWNEVTKYFRAEMPRRKHRQHFKKYGNCFTAAEAISWLHELLRNNRNFGPEVTRQQTVQLLRKFLKNHVIEDIKGRWGSENLDDNHILYRILPRQCLNEDMDNVPKGTEHTFKLSHFSKRTPKKHEFQEYQENISFVKSEKKMAHSRRVTQVDIEEVWRNLVLIHLQTILGIPSLEEVLSPAQVIPQYVMYNMTNISKRGVVLLQDKSEDLPHWVLSAMKCLANWPRSNDMSQPTYVGFERDVFKTVADYFLSLSEPLLTFEYYDLFMNVLVLCGYVTIPNRSSGKSSIRNDLEVSKTPHLNSFKSTECLLLSLLHRDKKDEPGTSEIVSKNCTAEKECATKPPHCIVACKHAPVHERISGSCHNLSRLKNEQSLSLKLKTRCCSLEGIVDASSSKCNKDGLKICSEPGIHIMPFTNKEDQLLHSEAKPDPSLDLCSDITSQKQEHGFKRVSALNVPDQELCSSNHKPKQLCRSRSLRGNSNSSWCGVHVPVAEITIKLNPVVPLGQKIQNTTKVVAKIGSKPGDYNMAIKKRLWRSTSELSENTFPPSSFLLTGTSSLLQPHLERVAIEALQICCVLLPPPNRRKLQLLMRMISRMSENVDMPRLHDAVGTKSLMIQTFSRCILCCEEEVDFDELLAARLVSFLMDHHQEILDVPTYLWVAVQDHIETLKTTQLECLSEEMSTIFPTYSYCKRITSQEFDEQKISTSQAAVTELLENIIKDKYLSLKDKKKKLKQFQKEYPQIYQNRFPTTESEAILFVDKPTIKQPMLSLRKPKFRGIRH
ncbi:DEP domain-containing protein 1A isoform X3 [Hemicordylus capensis]|uniref:DEP domain-containing protein 1A isoform X3 n=1 Tax=Hemicordylus capensis TaxID=884348 RepID=UPI002304A717|nr:DEP domain-containing protein 1A isoform X3 [Hemicordylus capensis]